MLPKLIASLALALLAVAGAALAQSSMQELIGAGDTVRISAFRHPELATETRVTEAGEIQVPFVGALRVAGLTPERAAALIAAELKRGDYVLNPEIQVSVLQARSRQVSVLGQVARPGRYTLDGAAARLSEVIALAGGIAPAGSDTVFVKRTRRGASETLQVDLADIVRDPASAKDIELASGDQVFVPRAPVVYVYGEVTRAGAVRLEPGMTVMQAISLAGGVTPRGSERFAKLRRKADGGGWTEKRARPFEGVLADDVIYVRESLF